MRIATRCCTRGGGGEDRAPSLVTSCCVPCGRLGCGLCEMETIPSPPRAFPNIFPG
ncbi:hypothetical protein E2C01_070648 [Portunus trituberculatus]|uniref:Uncharacterized protein n=1 Tax=Portunus trituberculatus TaxID=210409 RepID=A0A5B7HT95_PORTR|nr:hypothetical protein [Portunus trituberculatus]